MSFIAQITADTSNFDNNVKKAVDITNNSVSKMQSQFEKLGDSFVKIGAKASILSTAIIGATVGLVKMGIDAGNASAEINNLSTATSLSTDLIQELSYVATASNSSFGGLQSSMKSFQRRLKTVGEEGSKVDEMFGKLGVSTTDASGKVKSMDDVLLDTFNKLGDMENGLAKNAIGAELFGGSWNEVSLIVSSGSKGIAELREEANKLGLVLDENTLQSSDDFATAMELVGFQVDKIKSKIGAGFVPILQETVLPLLQEKIIPAVSRFADYIAQLSERFNALSPSTKTAIFALGGIATAIGPVLLGLGGIIKILPLVMAGFTAITGPVGIAIAAIAVISFALYELIKPLTKTNTVTKEVANSTKQLYQELGKEQIEVDKLFVAYKSANVGTEEHKRIKDQIISKYGQFLKGQVDEEGNIINIDNAYKQLNNSLRDQIALKIKNQRLETISISNINAQAKAITELTSKVDQSDRVKFGVRLNEELRDFSNSADKDLDKLFGKLATLTRDEFGIDLMKSDGLFDKNAFNSIRTLIDSMKESEMQAQGVEIAFAGISEEVKTLNEEIEDTIIIAPKLTEAIDIFQSGKISEAIRVTSNEIKTLGDYLLDLQTGKIVVANVHDEIVKTQERLNVLNTALNTLTGNRELNIKVNTDVQGIKKVLDNKFFKDGKFVLPPIDTSALDASMGDLSQKADAIEMTVGDVLGNLFAGASTAIMEGDNVMTSLASSMLGMLGGIMVDLGKMSLAIGIGLEAIQKSLLSLNPALAIGAGVALIALGSMFSAGARKLGGSMGSGGGYSGSSSMQNTRVATPMPTGEFRDSYSSGQVEFTISGDNLVGVLNKKETRRNRNL